MDLPCIWLAEGHVLPTEDLRALQPSRVNQRGLKAHAMEALLQEAGELG